MKIDFNFDATEVIQSAIEVLEQGEVLLAALTDEAYTRRLPGAFNASIGGHYRHCLDHFRNLVESVSSNNLNYDQRERGTAVEHDREAALKATIDLRAACARLEPHWLEDATRITCQTRYAAAGSQSAGSTLGREIMYVVAHAVHHYALIGIMGGMQNITLPTGFGVAPSTLKHEQEKSNAAWN